jgi:hypothetical protein
LKVRANFKIQCYDHTDNRHGFIIVRIRFSVVSSNLKTDVLFGIRTSGTKREAGKTYTLLMNSIKGCKFNSLPDYSMQNCRISPRRISALEIMPFDSPFDYCSIYLNPLSVFQCEYQNLKAGEVHEPKAAEYISLPLLVLA